MMNRWRRFTAWLRKTGPLVHLSDEEIEHELLHNGPILLDLSPELQVSVDVNKGLVMLVTERRPMTEKEGRRLLLAARYLPVTDAPPEGTPAVDDHSSTYDPATGTYTIGINREDRRWVGDVMAAYFRLIEEETDPRG
jgi:hypothetical protein